MVKVSGPLFSIPGGLPVRKARKIYAPAPPPETILVTAGDPPPDPDCTGTYEFFQMCNGIKAYRRLPEFDFFLWGEYFHLVWNITDVLGDFEFFYWSHEYGMIGTYLPASEESTGEAVIS